MGLVSDVIAQRSDGLLSRQRSSDSDAMAMTRRQSAVPVVGETLIDEERLQKGSVSPEFRLFSVLTA